MSGGGGSVTDGWTEGQDVDCHDLVFEAVITSLQTDAVTSLPVDEILKVALESPEDIRMIALRRDPGGLVGTLTTGRIGDLLRCLQQGVEFVAEVLSIDESVVRVRVRPKP